MKRLAPAFLLCLASLSAASKVVVTVVESKTGKPVTGLKAADFTLLDDKTPRRVEDAEFSRDTLDVMLLLDTGLMGGVVQPVAENLIAQLEPKEQMAIVAFHSSADLIQDFTSSRQLLSRAVAKVKYGNSPHVLDALYAAIDGGFQGSSFRRVIVLIIGLIESVLDLLFHALLRGLVIAFVSAKVILRDEMAFVVVRVFVAFTVAEAFCALVVRVTQMFRDSERAT